MSTIITCIDTNSVSEEVLNFASLLVKKNNFKLQILAVIEGSHRNLLFGSNAISNQKHLTIQKHLKKLVDNICLKNGVNPTISIREGDIVAEITKEFKMADNCKMLIFGKSQNSQSDNIVLPQIIDKIGKKINVPVLIIPEGISKNFGENFWQELI